LRGEALLYLQPSRKRVNQARDLREANDATARHVANGGDARERKEVVFAEGVERDPLNHNEVASGGTRRLFEDGAENLVWVAGVATCKFKKGPGNTAWGVDESVASWVLADGAQNGAGGIGN
jgi:hypothetical protein